MRILVADDSRVMRQIVARTLRQAGWTGHTLIEAADGVQTLDLARSANPDLVLSDWNMPGLTGLEVLRLLRAGGSEVPFGFVTSESSPERRAEAYDAGAQFLIGKPFGADDFRELIAPALPPEPPAPRGTGLPPNKAVRDLFEALLGRDVAVTPCPPVQVGPGHPAQLAVLVDDALRMVVVAVVDLPLAVRCGAALELVPSREADALLADRVALPDAMRRTIDEVFNIASTLFNVPGAPHVRLYATYAPGDGVPADVAAVLGTVGRRLDLEVAIAGYGTGRLGLLLAT